MKIKDYNEFLLEKFSSSEFEINYQKIISFEGRDQFDVLKSERQFMYKMRNEFAFKIKGLSEYFDSFYSSLASSDSDPEVDFGEMQKIISRSGFTLEVIKKLFDKKVCELTSQYYPYFINKNKLDVINGYIDTYLYILDEKLSLSENFLVDLGGGHGDYLKNKNVEILDSVIQTDKNESINEWLIKYAYGYHMTKYGNLLFDSIDLTAEEFVKIAKEKLFKNILMLWLIENGTSGLNKIIIDELKQEDFCRKIEDKWILQLERLWSISSSRSKDYESFKDTFINWLQTKGIEEYEMIDDDNILEIEV
jgi:hypothetical protein